MDIAVLEIDLGKNSCSAVGLDGSGKVMLRRRMQRNAFMGELVEHVEHPVFASLVGAVLDKVVGPDMIALLRPNAALGLLMGNL
jgi:hypothetical protein